MKLLLDTHAFLWYISNDPRLPQHAYDAIRDKTNNVYLSVVSVWEIFVKYQIGKLPLPAPPEEFIEASRSAHRIEDLSLDGRAVSHLISLPMHHRDPFDRTLICQALKDDLTIVTTDEWFNRYAAKILTAA